MYELFQEASQKANVLGAPESGRLPADSSDIQASATTFPTEAGQEVPRKSRFGVPQKKGYVQEVKSLTCQIRLKALQSGLNIWRQWATHRLNQLSLEEHG